MGKTIDERELADEAYIKELLGAGTRGQPSTARGRCTCCPLTVAEIQTLHFSTKPRPFQRRTRGLCQLDISPTISIAGV